MNYVYSDGGRIAAGFKGKCEDCVARAIAIAADRPYAEVYNELATWPRRSTRQFKSPRTGIMTRTVWFREYMTTHGWKWTPTMQVGQGCKVHLRSEELPAGRLIVSMSRHYAAVIDGVLYDNHDCSREGKRCVYGYWSRAS